MMAGTIRQELDSSRAFRTPAGRGALGAGPGPALLKRLEPDRVFRPAEHELKES